MRQSGQQVRDLALVGIPNNPLDAWEGGQFLGSALRIAACYENAAPWIQAVRMTHGLPDIVIGRRGDGASVENDEIRRGNIRHAGETPDGKLRFERGAIGLRGAAAEILHKEAGHLNSFEFTKDTYDFSRR
jgi:hypothetical protein